MDIDADIPPPVYSEFSASSSVSGPSLPREFSVGKFKTPPVIAVEDLQAHLRVLGAFSKLKEDVHHMNGGSQQEKDQAWVVYVNRAVHRFNTFMGTEWEGEFPGWTEENAPPLDVLM
ncbi:560_t:CDS:1, partial [Acaulospora colombiana]